MTNSKMTKLLALIGLGWALFGGTASAQTLSSLCVKGMNGAFPTCVDVSPTNPLPVTPLASGSNFVPVGSAVGTPTIGILASTTSVTATNMTGYPFALVTFNGTYGNSTGAFEISDDAGITWYAISASMFSGLGVSNAIGVSESGWGQGGNPLTNNIVAFLVPTGGAPQFRVRATTITSGSINIRITPVSGASQFTQAAQIFVRSGGTVSSLSGNQPLDGVANSGLNPSLYVSSFPSIYNSAAQTWTRWKDIASVLSTGLGTPGVSIAPTAVAGAGIIPTVTTSGNSLQITANNSYSAYATNYTATAGFLIGYNSASVPGTGTLTAGLILDCVPLPANGAASINDSPGPVTRYSAGVVFLLTSASSCLTYTTGTVVGFIKAKAL